LKLTRKIGKLAQPLTYRRGWRRVQRYLFPLPLDAISRDIDPVKLREIQQRYERSPAGYAKYANIVPWLRLNRERVQDLELHRSAPKHVLDLGCGGGFFLFILKSLGHSGLGLDTGQVPLYAELLELFGVERIIWTIRPFEPLPNLATSFDWITAFSVSFNTDRLTQRLWDVEEWDFFLRDLQRHLAPAGKIFLGLNPSFSGDYYTPELRDLFVSRGAEIEREKVFFPNGVQL
jgi:SAM-dependent methyltransferase